jgi:hypothetical protein
MFMNFKLSQKGQAIILLAFAIVGLVGFGALAIDGGRVLSDKRHAQNAADTSAYAAALAKVNGGNLTAMTTAARNRAISNGYDDSTTLQDVVINNPPASGPYAGNSEYVQVIITSRVNTTFARVIGRSQVTNKVEAVARAQGSTSGGSLFGGAAMVATKTGNYNQCFLMNGGAMVYTHNSGIFINCSGSQALFMNGGAQLDMDANGQIVGCFGYNGGAVYDPITCSVAQQTLDAAYFSTFPKTQTPPTCSSNGSVSGSGTSSSGTPPNVTINSGATGTLNPGNFGNIIINGSGATAVFNPGTYCISGNFNLNGNSSMSGPSGRVIFVLQDQNLVMNGGSVINFNDLEIYGRNASFLLNGSAIFRATRMRMFSTGTGTFTVNGGSELTSSNAYFYLYRGNIVWNGSSILNLHAPPQGDPFGGLLIHMPWGNTNNVTLNGGSSINLVGTFLAPQCPITYNGSVSFVLHSQIIGYSYIVNGGADIDIYFVPSENYGQPSNPTIELAQ